ncbi:hypothetical protein FK482_0053 [Listeria phage LP-013]|uniref:Uncharacterized protein n=1 Tax=Listeria phage LP-013 TaxID=2590047 RepID=A0A514U702_9CAUD|nr:hypothetical protein FK482_0053 [Listeria phage LP-013]
MVVVLWRLININSLEEILDWVNNKEEVLSNMSAEHPYADGSRVEETYTHEKGTILDWTTMEGLLVYKVKFDNNSYGTVWMSPWDIKLIGE